MARKSANLPRRCVFRWPERRHTFRKEVTEGMPGKTKSLVVLAVIVTVSWLVLLGLVSRRIHSFPVFTGIQS